MTLGGLKGLSGGHSQRGETNMDFLRENKALRFILALAVFRAVPVARCQRAAAHGYARRAFAHAGRSGRSSGAADAIRDCDGTDYPEALKSVDAKVYSTYYTTRKDNAWAKANPDEVQQCYIMTGFHTAVADSLSIPLMQGIIPMS